MKDIRTTVIGNATGDPRETQYPNGDISVMVRIAVNSRYYDQDINDYNDRKTEFVNVYARRALARNVLASVKKGQPLVATGRLGSTEWTDDDGKPFFSLTLNAETIGHDLTFGTSAFTKPAKAPKLADVPDLDYDTGEIKPAPTGQDEDGYDTDSLVGDADADNEAAERALVGAP